MSEKQETTADVVFTLAIDSYRELLRQSDLMDSRVQTLLTLATTVSLAFIAAVAAQGVKFSSGWFAAAGVFYLAGVVSGIVAQFQGDVNVVSPNALLSKGFEQSAHEFKLKFIKDAALDFNKNRAHVKVKWRLAVLSAALFLLEAVLLVLWVAQQG